MLTRHFGPMARLATRQELRRQGHGFASINRIMSGWDDALVDVAVAQTGSTVPADLMEQDEGFGAIGDGTIIQAIIDFIKSPTGQAIIQALVKLLLTALIAL